MGIEIRMPDLGTADAEIEIVEWLIEVGQSIVRGQAILVVETDKAALEVESIATGVLQEVRATAGDEVAAGDVIAVVEVECDAETGIEPSPTPGPGATSEAALPEPKSDAPIVPAPAQSSGPKPARKGMFARNRQAAAKGREGRRQPARFRDNQRAVTRRLAQSHREIIPFNMVCRIETSAMARRREELETELQRRVGYNPFFIHAIARIVRDMPCFLDYRLGDDIGTYEKANIGFVVGFDRALHTPVVYEADSKFPVDIGREVGRLALNAARGKLSVDDCSGACMIVSDLSGYPIQSFHAVIPPGSSGAVAVGGVEETPIVRDGVVVAVPAALVTLTVDHRVVNGRNAAIFLTRLKEHLEAL
jgi:pyruvate/2-oxoglutarate dehydrogenase complex dihydrolipoamide acyltransferase (E2) component